MDPDSFHRARTEAGIAQYWRNHREHCRKTLTLRVTAAALIVFSTTVGVLCFRTALRVHDALWKTGDIALAAVELTVAISVVGRWPKWPKVDPHIKQIERHAEELRRRLDGDAR